ncbi:protein LEG1 homolog [Hyla sarda]|uniref:protein LEG1 homolog n=1 Tax=Hyla sarda TaxID=327740 RepID=UPI0024C31CA5|nr:protein LEG1 homolog [Hyla sarda]
MENNTFLFDDVWYRQIGGVAMGTPVACTLANLYVAAFEYRHIFTANNPFLRAVRCYLRFVDDVFIAWDGTERDFEDFVKSLNETNEMNLRFTYKIDAKRIEFLDVLVEINGGDVQTSGYRKPTASNSLLQYTSYHPEHVKTALPYGQFLRLRRINSSDEKFLVQAGVSEEERLKESAGIAAFLVGMPPVWMGCQRLGRVNAFTLLQFGYGFKTPAWLVFCAELLAESIGQNPEVRWITVPGQDCQVAKCSLHMGDVTKSQQRTIFCRATMLLFLWLVLAIGYPVVSSQNENYPPLWELVPENLTDFNIQSEKVIINPWNYLERMGMYKILLNVTAPFLDMKEQDNKKNVLWGLPLQHGWQYHTGRLQDTSSSGKSGEDQTVISVKSWWACMNYYLAVIPFLGAIDAGLFEGFPYGIVISQPNISQSDFCCSIEECRSFSAKTMDEWKAFFESIMTSNKKSDTSVPELTKEEERVLSNLWRAHMESIAVALPRCSDRLHHLSESEGNFGMDWATAVEFIAASNFPTNFQITNDFQTFLPKRILKEGDKAPYIPDFSEQENRVLATLHLLNKANTFTGGFLLKLWKKAMCSEEGRAAGRKLLQNMVTDPNLAPNTIIKIIIELAKNSACDVQKNRQN